MLRAGARYRRDLLAAAKAAPIKRDVAISNGFLSVFTLMLIVSSETATAHLCCGRCYHSGVISNRQRSSPFPLQVGSVARSFLPKNSDV